MISKFISVLACVDKNIAFKSISVALRLLNSQWKMHHCDVLCLVISSLCSLQAYNYAEHLYNIYCFYALVLILLAHPRTLHKPHLHMQRTAT